MHTHSRTPPPRIAPRPLLRLALSLALILALGACGDSREGRICVHSTTASCASPEDAAKIISESCADLESVDGAASPSGGFCCYPVHVGSDCAAMPH